MVAANNKGLVRRLYERGWNNGDLRVLDELVAPEFFDHHHGQGGPENLKGVIASLRTTFPDMRFTVEDQLAQGDRAMTRWTISGTDEGGLLGLSPTGRRANFGGIFVDRVANGRIVEHWGQSDMVGLLAQLGLMPPVEQNR